MLKPKIDKYKINQNRVRADVNNFLANGGTINVIADGATSNTKLTAFELPVDKKAFDDIDRIIHNRRNRIGKRS